MSENTPLKDWSRPYFAQAGESGLFYFVVYGGIAGEFTIDGGKYRVDHMPESLNLSRYGILEDAQTVDQFRADVFIKMLEEQEPELVQAVKQQEQCYIAQALFPDAPNLNDARVLIGIITYLLDSGATAVFDPLALKWWSAQKWREEVFQNEEFNPFAHVNILLSKEHNDTMWVHTRGMRKFGRPDLSVHFVTEEEMPAIQELINRFINYQALGGMIEEGQEIRMDTLPEGMKCTHKGRFDDPDFNNVYVEILWPELAPIPK